MRLSTGGFAPAFPLPINQRPHGASARIKYAGSLWWGGTRSAGARAVHTDCKWGGPSDAAIKHPLASPS